MIQTNGQTIGSGLVGDLVMLAVVMVHESVDDSKVEQVQVEWVLIVGLDRSSNHIAVGAIVEADTAPSAEKANIAAEFDQCHLYHSHPATIQSRSV